MTKFEDQLFTDLMEEHRPALQRLEQTVTSVRRVPVRRVAWLTGVATTGAATAAGVLLLGGSASAYAVSQHPNGTVTVALTSYAGVKPANLKLRTLGDPVVVVPVKPGCPSIASLPKPKATTPTKITATGSESDGTLTVDAQGVPAGDTMIIAASTLPNGGMELSAAVISGPVPSCVSLPAPPSDGSGGSGGIVTGNGSGGTITRNGSGGTITRNG
jgi:hypothetical protein